MEKLGWIKLHRKLIDWQWYSDHATCRLFFHLLLTANHNPAKWRGYEIGRGQKLTSLESLATETGLTVQQIRTVIRKLKSTGEITSTSSSKNTIITITNYNSYQHINTPSNIEITNEQQTTNKQLTTNKNKENNKKKEKGVRLNDFCLSVLEESMIEDFKSDPEEVMPDIFGNIWKERRGEVNDRMWAEWTKFYKHFTSADAKKPVRKDWETTWINWITR